MEEVNERERSTKIIVWCFVGFVLSVWTTKLKYLEENSGGGFFTFHPTYCKIDKS